MSTLDDEAALGQSGADAQADLSAPDVAANDANDAKVGLPHQPALDGIRGLAVGAVVLYHAAAIDGVGWLEPVTRGGFLGVSAFFTLSGFLICSLLLAERGSTGTVSLGRFWERRARRLLPAVLLLIGSVVVLTPLVGTQSQLASLPGDAWASLFYVANWRFILEGSDYAAMFVGAPSPLRHLWSLGIEEQWYVLVPLAALVMLRWGGSREAVRRRTLLVFLVAAIAASTAAMVVVAGGSWDNRAYMGTGTRLAEMTVGALAAVLVGHRAGNGYSFTVPPRARRILNRVAPVLLIAVLASWAFTPLRSAWLYRGGLTLHATAVAVLLVAVVQSTGGLRNLLGSRTLVALGAISYGVYLIHWPVIWWVTPSRLGLGPTAALVVQVLLTLALAIVSYRLLEQPIRRRRILRSRSGAVALVAGFVAVALAIVTLPEPDRSEVVALGSGVDLAVPTSTTTVAPDPVAGVAAVPVAPPPPPLKVMVVGDSFGESILIGLQRWGLLDGGAAVMDATIPACPFGRGGRNRGVGIRRSESAECRDRDATLLASMSDFDPDLVLVAGGMWDVTDRKPAGFNSWTRIGNPSYDEYLRGELRHLLDVVTSSGATVVWANSPHWDPVPGSVIFMGEPPYAEAQPERVDAFNALLAGVVAEYPAAQILDIAGWMNAQPGGEFETSLRPDGVHFSEASTDVVAAWLGPVVLTTAGR